MKLKDDYIAASCCRPRPGDEITGYFSHDQIIKVHKADCANLNKADSTRLISLDWPDILASAEFVPDQDYAFLDDVDFDLLRHHRQYGCDYSNRVAAMHNLDRQAVCDSHARLRDRGLIRRVEAKIIQYRKNIVPGKWIKHRNHTYYDLTDKGEAYLDYHLGQNKKAEA